MKPRMQIHDSNLCMELFIHILHCALLESNSFPTKILDTHVYFEK